MFDINYPDSNVSTYLKNFSTAILYGVNIQNELFKVLPENNIMLSNVVYVFSKERSSPNEMVPRIFAQRHYQLPMEGLPLYLEELGCILFISDAERSEALKQFESGRRMVQSYASGLTPLINGTYIAITCLSNRMYYQVSGNTIEELPNTAQDIEFVNKAIRDYDIPRGKMQTNDVFIINTIIKKGKDRTKDINVKTEVKYIERSSLIPGQPILFSNNGYVLFDKYEDAEYFLRNYGNVGNYMIQRGLYATRERQKVQIEELNKKASNDKKGIIQMFVLMGGTSICSIFAENLIKSIKEGESGEETARKLLKIIGIGILGVGTVMGIYMGYQKFIEWKDKKNKEEKIKQIR
jgi:hypothetical protein